MSCKSIAASLATWTLAFVLFGGCGGGNSLSVSDYKTSCTAVSDCVKVSIGNVCALCPNPDAAINIADEDRYNADFARARSACGEAVQGAHPCLATVNTPPVTCTSGKCTMQ